MNAEIVNSIIYEVVNKPLEELSPINLFKADIIDQLKINNPDRTDVGYDKLVYTTWTTLPTTKKVYYSDLSSDKLKDKPTQIIFWSKKNKKLTYHVADMGLVVNEDITRFRLRNVNMKLLYVSLLKNIVIIDANSGSYWGHDAYDKTDMIDLINHLYFGGTMVNFRSVYAIYDDDATLSDINDTYEYIHLSSIAKYKELFDEPCDCSICSEPMSKSETSVNLKVERIGCDHRFHKSCIANWNKINKTCPLCRGHSDVKMASQ